MTSTILTLAGLQTACLISLVPLYLEEGDPKLAALSLLYALCNAVVFLWK